MSLILQIALSKSFFNSHASQTSFWKNSYDNRDAWIRWNSSSSSSSEGWGVQPLWLLSSCPSWIPSTCTYLVAMTFRCHFCRTWWCSCLCHAWPTPLQDRYPYPDPLFVMIWLRGVRPIQHSSRDRAFPWYIGRSSHVVSLSSMQVVPIDLGGGIHLGGLLQLLWWTVERRHQHDNQKFRWSQNMCGTNKMVYWKLLTKDHNCGGGWDEGVVPNKVKEIQ